MRRLALLALVVPLIAACGGSPHSETTAPSLASEIVNDVPSWVTKENLPPNAVPGARLFAVAGCTACHTYLGAGSSNLGAPDLTAFGRHPVEIAAVVRHLQCPSCTHADSPMPPFRSLGYDRLRQLAIFLVNSKGTH